MRRTIRKTFLLEGETVTIRKQIGLFEVPLRQAHVIFAALPAGMARL